MIWMIIDGSCYAGLYCGFQSSIICTCVSAIPISMTTFLLIHREFVFCMALYESVLMKPLVSRGSSSNHQGVYAETRFFGIKRELLPIYSSVF